MKIITPILKTEQNIYQLINSAENNQENLSNRAEINYLRAENTLLRDAIEKNPNDRILAGVIGRPPALPYDVMVIDRGVEDGILENAPVYSSDNQVIGFVIATYKKSAVVALISTPEFTSTVYVYGPNIYTTAIGQGGGVIRIHVPQGVSLEVGNTVIIPSVEAGIFGEIVAIDSLPSNQEQYGYVVSNLSLSTLRYVSVSNRPMENIEFEQAKELVGQAKQELLKLSIPAGILVDVDTATSSNTETATGTEANETQE